MAGTIIAYEHGELVLGGNSLAKWQSGNINIETPFTEVKVMAEHGIVDGFVSGPIKCSFDVENAIPASGIEGNNDGDFVELALGRKKVSFNFFMAGKKLTAEGYLTSVKFSDSPDAQPKCNFSAVCAAPTWEDK